MKKIRVIMIMLLFVVVTGCSNINSEQQEDNGIAIKQQVVVPNYIFDSENIFNAENLEQLKSIMYIAEFDNGCLYGKTGSGTDGKAWFVGFMEENDNRIYFAVYLDDIKNKVIVSGNKAKEIAISILSNEV